MKELVKLIKDHKNEICWYPSSGSDIESFNLWNNNFGNEYFPKLFIYTDVSFLISNVKNNFFNLNGTFIEIPKDFQVEEFSLNRFYMSDEELKNVKLSKLKEKYPISPENNQFNFDLGNDEILISLYKLGLIESKIIENLIVYDYTQTLTNYFVLKKNGISILLLQSTNMLFYDFLLKNNFSIDCLMYRRPIDLFLLDRIYEVISQLNIKEVIAGRNDLTMSDVISEFNWTTHYYTDRAFFTRIKM
jgi:hypothetical protein